MFRQLFSSGSPWESVTGYSRAVRAGNLLFISATADTGANGQVLHPDNPYEQTRAILARLSDILREAGASLHDVAQTRLYVRDIASWAEIGRAHGEVFREILPATSLIEVKGFLDPAMLVEIEAIAVIPPGEGEAHAGSVGKG